MSANKDAGRAGESQDGVAYRTSAMTAISITQCPARSTSADYTAPHCLPVVPQHLITPHRTACQSFHNMFANKDAGRAGESQDGVAYRTSAMTAISITQCPARSTSADYTAPHCLPVVPQHVRE
ncbi:hypothetical protein J6590_037737 [Homalodisca vitripennis]|nr:hypothetical protein J6590_037737 [Homalodisca vitripennis]